MKAPHFGHPETHKMSLTREGSISRNNVFVYRGMGSMYESRAQAKNLAFGPFTGQTKGRRK